jgi:hypothetical protein
METAQKALEFVSKAGKQTQRNHIFHVRISFFMFSTVIITTTPANAYFKRDVLCYIEEG